MEKCETQNTLPFYSYLWLREDGTPYYAGKRHGSRAYINHRHHRPPKDRTRIVLYPAVTEAEAFASEIVMIDLFGRKDLGTGCLHNRTDGGDGTSGYVYSPEQKEKRLAEETGYLCAYGESRTSA